MERRTLLTGMAAAPLLATAGQAQASSSRTYSTLILAPHQDDEISRFSGYIPHSADRGDHIELMCATDGSSTGVRSELGLTRAETTRWRNREMEASWSWLTDGKGGRITHIGQQDGSASRSAIRAAVERRLEAMPGNPELYVATWHHDRSDTYSADKHPDHVACVLAARDIAAAHGTVVRYGRHLRGRLSGTVYRSTGKQALRVEGAVAAYKVIGQRSTRTFDYILANPASYVTK